MLSRGELGFFWIIDKVIYFVDKGVGLREMFDEFELSVILLLEVIERG